MAHEFGEGESLAERMAWDRAGVMYHDLRYGPSLPEQERAGAFAYLKLLASELAGTETFEQRAKVEGRRAVEVYEAAAQLDDLWSMAESVGSAAVTNTLRVERAERLTFAPLQASPMTLLLAQLRVHDFGELDSLLSTPAADRGPTTSAVQLPVMIDTSGGIDGGPGMRHGTRREPQYIGMSHKSDEPAKLADGTDSSYSQVRLRALDRMLAGLQRGPLTHADLGDIAVSVVGRVPARTGLTEFMSRWANFCLEVPERVYPNSVERVGLYRGTTHQVILQQGEGNRRLFSINPLFRVVLRGMGT